MLDLVGNFLSTAKLAEQAEGDDIIAAHLRLHELLKPAIEQMRQFVAYEHGHRVSEDVARMTQERISEESAVGNSKSARLKAGDIHVQVNKEIFG